MKKGSSERKEKEIWLVLGILFICLVAGLLIGTKTKKQIEDEGKAEVQEAKQAKKRQEADEWFRQWEREERYEEELNRQMRAARRRR